MGTDIPSMHPTFDLLIRRGLVVDGSGAKGKIADVGISGERVAAVGDLGEARGRREIEAEGKVVCPGFVDIHGHSEVTILADPRAESKVRQGVTTEVVGNCGFGVAPVSERTLAELKGAVSFTNPDLVAWNWRNVGEYVGRLKERRPALNVAVLAGHIPLRATVMGFGSGQPGKEQVAEIANLANEALDQGAIGLSTGLIYPPACYAQTEELIALGRVAARGGALFSIHIRDEGRGLLTAVEEAIEIAERSGCRVEISHLKSAGKRNWGMIDEAIGLVEKAAGRGLEIGFDAYPYLAGSTTMTTLIPDEFHEGGQSRLLERLADPKTHQRILEATIRKAEEKVRVGEEEQAFDNVVVGSVCSEKNTRWQGKRLVEMAAAWGVGPGEAVLRLIAEEEGKVSMVFFVAREEDLEKVLAHPLCAIGSDGLAVAPTGPTRLDYCHPRYYGTYPRFLVRYVREKKLVSLEEAIRKATSLPAQRLGFKDRGLLKPGFFADVVIMNYENLTDPATYENPHEFPEGIEYVIVNGEVGVDNAVQVGSGMGRVL